MAAVSLMQQIPFTSPALRVASHSSNRGHQTGTAMFQHVPSSVPIARNRWFASVDTLRPLDSAPSELGVKLNDFTWTVSNSNDAAERGC
jgi:hypothetical protein